MKFHQEGVLDWVYGPHRVLNMKIEHGRTFTLTFSQDENWLLKRTILWDFKKSGTAFCSFSEFPVLWS